MSNFIEREPEGFVEKDRSRGQRRSIPRRNEGGKKIHHVGQKKDRFRFDPSSIEEYAIDDNDLDV